jgi:hypothetical protein
MRRTKMRLSILIGILLTLFLLSIPNVVAVTHYVDVGDMRTIAPDWPGPLEAEAFCPSDQYIDIESGDTIVIYVDYQANDTSTSGLGSRHGFQLNVTYNCELSIDVTDFNLTPGQGRGGQLSVTYQNLLGEDHTFHVELLARVWDRDIPWWHTYDTDECYVTTY